MRTNENGARRARDALLVAALAAGESYSRAAKTADVSKATVARRMEERAFRAQVTEEREANVEAARRRLAASGPDAISVLAELCRGASSEIVRLGAARTLA